MPKLGAIANHRVRSALIRLRNELKRAGVLDDDIPLDYKFSRPSILLRCIANHFEMELGDLRRKPSHIGGLKNTLTTK